MVKRASNNVKMGTKKDNIAMYVKFIKRKRGVLKKAMEMAAQCIKRVYMLIHDRQSNQLVTYNSNPIEFSLDDIAFLMETMASQSIEKYGDSNYNQISGKPYLKKSSVPLDVDSRVGSEEE